MIWDATPEVGLQDALRIPEISFRHLHLNVHIHLVSSQCLGDNSPLHLLVTTACGIWLIGLQPSERDTTSGAYAMSRHRLPRTCPTITKGQPQATPFRSLREAAKDHSLVGVPERSAMDETLMYPLLGDLASFPAYGYLPPEYDRPNGNGLTAGFWADIGSAHSPFDGSDLTDIGTPSPAFGIGVATDNQLIRYRGERSGPCCQIDECEPHMSHSSVV